MKFIREIIGEKRQMEENANKEAAPAPSDCVLGDDQPVQDAMMQVEEADADLSDEGDISDEFADFFAEDDEPDQIADVPVQDKDAPAPQPTKLVMASPFATDTDDQADMPEPPATTSEDDMAESAESGPSEEQEEDHSLQSVFRELNETPAYDIDEQPDDADSDLVDAPEMAHAEPALEEPKAQPEIPAAAFPHAAPSGPKSVEVPQPALGRGVSQHGRVKTRLLGFNTSMDTDIDPIKDSDQAKPAAYTSFPVGWLIVVDGEGRGSAFSLFNGVSNIGRGTDQTVCLDFGDNSISREAHASVAYDERQQSFFIGHTGKANIVRRNDRPVLSTEELTAGDHITIGETTLRFVPLCGPDFSWEKGQEPGKAYAANG